MKRWILFAGLVGLTGLLAAWFAPVANAQQWAPYVSMERDFRVVMPSSPLRTVTREGSTQYRAESGRYEYFVIRHDPRRLADVSNPREDVVNRMGGPDSVRGLPGDDGDFGRNEFILRSGGRQSMHHIFTEGGQYYELMVRPLEEDVSLDRELIRDYFASFQMGRGAAFTGRLALPTVESCDARGNSVSRMLCQYVACMPSANAAHPVCAGLPRLTR